MKRIMKFLAMFLIFIMLSGVLAYAADPTGNGTSTDSSTTSGQYGATKDRTGFLLYVVDSEGNRHSQVVFVPYKTIQSSVKGYPVDISGLVTRYGDSVDEFSRRSAPWKMGAWTTDGNYNLVGNGQKIKEFLMRGDNMANVLRFYLGFGVDDLKNFMENEWYLNVEMVMWMGLYSGARFQGKYYAGTAYTWSQVADGSQVCGFISHCVLPTSGYFEPGMDWVGLTAPPSVSSGVKIPSDEIQSYAYGIVSIRPGDGNDFIETDYTSTYDEALGTQPGPAPRPPKEGLTREIVKVYKSVDAITGEEHWDGTYYRYNTSDTIQIEDEPYYHVVECHADGRFFYAQNCKDRLASSARNCY